MELSHPHFPEKIPSVCPAQDAAVPPASRQGETCTTLRFPLPLVLQCCEVMDQCMEKLILLLNCLVSWFSPNKMTCWFKMKLSFRSSSNFSKQEDLFCNLIHNSDSLTSYSITRKTKHYDIFLPSVGCRCNFFHTSSYFYLTIHSHIIHETKMGRSWERLKEDLQLVQRAFLPLASGVLQPVEQPNNQPLWCLDHDDLARCVSQHPGWRGSHWRHPQPQESDLRQTYTQPTLEECQELLLTQENGCTLLHFATLGP